MALRGDSYSSTTEVKALTRRYLDGQTSWNSTTQPTNTELEKFLDRASAVLNVSMKGQGLGTPITNSTAKLLCDDWVTTRAVKFVELSQPHSAYGGGENPESLTLDGLHSEAMTFAKENALSFKRLGVSVTDPIRQGLTFTGLDKRADRSDPGDTSLVQPHFRRDQFSDPAISVNGT